jgi:ribosomal protein S18 acetylase RimI-like enzyme
MNSTEMEIIQIDASQAHLVFGLFDQYRVFYKQPSDITLAKNFIQARLDNHESVISQPKPVGFTQLYPTYSSVRVVKNWILNDLYVDNSYRKQGIGEKLIRTAMSFAKENNAKFVELSTAVDNYTAQSLYEQIGFEKQKPETDFFTYRIKLT